MKRLVSSTGSMWTLLVLMLVGFLAFDLVYIAVVVNYCAQCQLLIFLIRGMNERIGEKNVPLQQAIRVCLSPTAGCTVAGLSDAVILGISQCWQVC